MIDLKGAPVLIVEDEIAVSTLLEAAVSDASGRVVGPAIDIPASLVLIESEKLSAAILDLIVHGEYADAVAIELTRRGIPFAVTTGIGVNMDHPALRDAPIITKPFQAEYVQQLLARLIQGHPD